MNLSSTGHDLHLTRAKWATTHEKFVLGDVPRNMPIETFFCLSGREGGMMSFIIQLRPTRESIRSTSSNTFRIHTILRKANNPRHTDETILENLANFLRSFQTNVAL